MGSEVLYSLNSKLQQLTAQKATLSREFEARMSEVDAEIESVRQALSTVDDALKDVVCPVCWGRGRVRRAEDAADVRCDACGGTGIRP